MNDDIKFWDEYDSLTFIESDYFIDALSCRYFSFVQFHVKILHSISIQPLDNNSNIAE